jgi:hypothetical protein
VRDRSEPAELYAGRSNRSDRKKCRDPFWGSHERCWLTNAIDGIPLSAFEGGSRATIGPADGSLRTLPHLTSVSLGQLAVCTFFEYCPVEVAQRGRTESVRFDQFHDFCA